MHVVNKQKILRIILDKNINNTVQASELRGFEYNSRHFSYDYWI